MAGSAILERELNKQDVRAAKVREVSYDKQAQNPTAFYDMLRASQATWTSPAPREEVRREVKSEQVSAYDPTAERVKSYTQAPVAPARNKDLFKNYQYVNGELMEKDPETEAMSPAWGTAYAEPAVQEKQFAAPTYVDFGAPAFAEPMESVAARAAVESEAAENKDALPTRRTMDTVIRPSARVHEMTVTETRTGFKASVSALSVRMKVILCSVAAAIVLAIVLICVNTGIIRSLDSDLSHLKGRATQERTTYEYLQKESNLYTDPDSEIVTEWALENGMTK